MMKRVLMICLMLCSLGMMAACDDSAPAEAAAVTRATIESTVWVLAEIDGKPPIGNAPVTLRFLEGRIGGRSGCNSFSAPYTLENGQLSVKPEMVSTMMACLSDGLMEQERRYTDLLVRSEKAAIGHDGKLRMTTKDGDTLVFMPESPEAR